MGTNSTKGLASINIVCIIKACARHRVVTLKFGDLELSFDPKVKTPRPGSTKFVESHESQSVPHTQSPVTEITEQQQTNITREALVIDELALRDEQFAELLVTDPQAAEQMLVDGELDDDDESRGDDE